MVYLHVSHQYKLFAAATKRDKKIAGRRGIHEAIKENKGKSTWTRAEMNRQVSAATVEIHRPGGYYSSPC